MTLHDPSPGAGAPAPQPAGAARSPYLEPELYDLLFEGYEDDVPFYLGLARAAGGPVLDLACGTGRTLLRLLADGLDAEGLDLEPRMLRELQRKAEARGLPRPVVHVADMRAFALPRRYALIVSPFNALAHLLSPEDWIATLTRCREHLAPGGLLAFDVQTMSADGLEEPDGVPVQEFEVKYPDAGLKLRLWDTRWRDPVEQLQRSQIAVEEIGADGTLLSVHRFETLVRWVTKREMELLLRIAGFARWTFAGEHDGSPLDRDSMQLVVRAWAPGGPAEAA